ncbi:MAG: M28 family peptidase [Planctomycetaceae bacterium]|nr:MAG: M28 family peptidase [Planctomycetaceae bacterium]
MIRSAWSNDFPRPFRSWRGHRGIVAALLLIGCVAFAPLAIRCLATEPRPESSGGVNEAVLLRLQADMNYLASDELAGRDVGSPGIEAAARHIAESFTTSGLQTDLFDSEPFQNFKIPVGSELGAPERNRFVIRLGQSSESSASESPAVESASQPDANENAEAGGNGDQTDANQPDDDQTDDDQTDSPTEQASGAQPASAASRLTEAAAGEPFTAKLERDFRPLAIGGNVAASGPLLFAGYGITAEDRNYDDYASISAEGAVVLILRKEPPRPGDAARGRDSRHAYFETKVRNAAEHGAAAVLLINDAGSVDDAAAGVVARIERERQGIDELQRKIDLLPPEAVNVRATLASRRGEIESMIQQLERDLEVAKEGLLDIGGAGNRVFVKELPVLSISRTLASELIFRAHGKTLDELQAEIDQQGQPQSLVLDATVELETEVTAAEASAYNVLGVLPGRGRLADQTVVVGAHYDHVGMGGPGSLAPGTIAVHNGADDNASGTTVMLASVDQIRDRLAEIEDHRRVVFIAFTAEERGLLGSEHYVRNPRFPLESTVAMLNLDMVGRLADNDLTVYGTGTSPGFDELLDRVNEKTGFSLFKVPSGYGPSDHQSFYQHKIPVLFFFTGLHSDYHRPSDTADKINFEGMARITEIATLVASEFATTETPPEYAETTRDVKIRQQSKAYLGVSLRDVTNEEFARFAPPPDQLAQPDAVHPRGAIVTDVAEGSPAESAGIRAADRVVKLAGRELVGVPDLVESIGSQSVNAKVTLELDRSGERVEVTVTLQKRPGD